MEYMPKNIRQIGGNEERVKIYLEDYVSTYLRRVREEQGEHGAAGFLVGSWQQDTHVPCAFLSGAMRISRAGMDGGQVSFSPEAWNEGYEILGTYFSGQELCGFFVCEGSGRRFRKQSLFAAARECFPDRPALLYLLTEEGEEILYHILPRGEERLQGYYCYFERNEAMQDFMVDHLPDRKVEWELSQGWRQEPKKSRGQEGSLGEPVDPALQFRKKMGRNKRSVEKAHPSAGRGIVALCATMALVIVVSGMGLAYREKAGVQIQEILSRLHIDPDFLAAVSAMPEETGEHYVGRENHQNQENTTGDSSPSILVEEIPGNVYPTEGEVPESSLEPESASQEFTEPESASQESETIQQEPESARQEPLETEPTKPSLSESTSDPDQATPELEESFPVGTGVLYTVKEGDSLYSISRRFYGTEEMAVVIQQMNHLENADLIKVGQELLLP